MCVCAYIESWERTFDQIKLRSELVEINLNDSLGGNVEPILSPSLCGVQIVIDTPTAEVTVLLCKWSLDQIQAPLYSTS